MTAVLEAPVLGVQTPSVFVAQDFEETFGPEACELSAEYDLKAYEFQEFILDVMMATKTVGEVVSWLHTTVGVSLPRQNGKGGAVEIRALWGLLRGETILWTFHDARLAEKLYERFASFFDPQHGALRKYLSKNDPHECQIITTLGSSIQFVTRVSGSGRGQSYDLLIFDEAQELDTNDEEALRPTVSSAPLGNPQIIFLGTPPRKPGQGEPSLRFRTQCLSKTNPRFCWMEWSAKRDKKGLFIDDREQYLIANPRIGQGMTMETVEDDRYSMTPEGFCRERLGMWDTHSSDNRLFPEKVWNDLKDSDSTVPETQYLVVEVDPGRKYSAITLAGRLPSGKVYLELIASARGTDWVADEIESLLDDPAYSIQGVCMDEKSATATLAEEFKERKIRVYPVKSADIAVGVGLFHDAVFQGGLVHIGQEQLTTSVLLADTVAFGKMLYWAKKRGQEEQSNIISTASTALWAATTSKTIRRPRPPLNATYEAGRRTFPGQQWVYQNGRRVKV